MDESVINGAQLFFPQQFNISTDPAIAGSASKAATNQWILGLVTGAPYVCLFLFPAYASTSAFPKHMNSDPLHRYFIIYSCTISCAVLSLAAG